MSRGGIRITRERRQREEASRQKQNNQNLGGIEMTNLQQTGAEEIVIEEAIVSNIVQEEVISAPTEADVNPLINKEISAVLQHVKDTGLMSTIDAVPPKAVVLPYQEKSFVFKGHRVTDLDVLTAKDKVAIIRYLFNVNPVLGDKLIFGTLINTQGAPLAFIQLVNEAPVAPYDVYNVDVVETNLHKVGEQFTEVGTGSTSENTLRALQGAPSIYNPMPSPNTKEEDEIFANLFKAYGNKIMEAKDYMDSVMKLQKQDRNDFFQRYMRYLDEVKSYEYKEKEGEGGNNIEVKDNFADFASERRHDLEGLVSDMRVPFKYVRKSITAQERYVVSISEMGKYFKNMSMAGSQMHVKDRTKPLPYAGSEKVFTFDDNHYASYLYINIFTAFDSMLSRAGYDEEVILSTFKKILTDDSLVLDYVIGDTNKDSVVQVLYRHHSTVGSTDIRLMEFNLFKHICGMKYLSKNTFEPKNMNEMLRRMGEWYKEEKVTGTNIKMKSLDITL